jgi:hypothetical protein
VFRAASSGASVWVSSAGNMSIIHDTVMFMFMGTCVQALWQPSDSGKPRFTCVVRLIGHHTSCLCPAKRQTQQGSITPTAARVIQTQQRPAQLLPQQRYTTCTHGPTHEATDTQHGGVMRSTPQL